MSIDIFERKPSKVQLKPEENPSFHHFKIKLGAFGCDEGNVVEMDGKVVPGITALSINASVDGATTVTMTVFARPEVELVIPKNSIFRRELKDPAGVGNPDGQYYSTKEEHERSLKWAGDMQDMSVEAERARFVEHFRDLKKEGIL